jgi:hypothetical protein
MDAKIDREENMTLRKLLTELSAQITQNAVRVSAMDRSLPANTQFTPEQVSNAIRQKVLVSGYKITQPINVRSSGGNRYSVMGPGINLVATVDINGRVDLWSPQQNLQPVSQTQIQGQPQPQAGAQ